MESPYVMADDSAKEEAAMRCFTVRAEAMAGLTVRTEPYAHVEVGEAGRGRRLTRVALGSRDFEVVPEVLARASAIRTRAKGTVLLVQEKDGDTRRALVLLAVPMGYRGGTAWDGLDDVTILAEGTVADGAAGRMGSYQEYLAILPPGARLVCRRYGRLYGAPAQVHVYWTGEELRVGTADEVCPPCSEADETGADQL